MDKNINNKSVFPFTGEEAVEFTTRISSALQVMNYAGFADTSINPVPEIDFFKDYDQYFDSSKNLIHIGMYGIVEMFHPADESDYMSALNYIYGHEQQHRRSTAQKPYGIAIHQGCKVILEHIQSQVEPFKRKFRKESDYANFANVVLPSMGIYISWNMVNQIVGGIANSIEDGRIERIRSNRFPGFDNLRRVYRGRYWSTAEHNYPPYEKVESNASEKLRLLTNEILSLSTCQLYNCGFAKAYVGTPLIEEVRSFMPYIAKGVLSGSTRGIIDPVSAICKLLAPYIFDTCRLSKTDSEMRAALEALLTDLIKSMVDQMPDNNGLSERDEDTDDGSLNSAFPYSDLVVTLDDETYDKLKEKSRKGDGDGILVMREHPDDDTSSEDKAEGAPGSSIGMPNVEIVQTDSVDHTGGNGESPLQDPQSGDQNADSQNSNTPASQQGVPDTDCASDKTTQSFDISGDTQTTAPAAASQKQSSDAKNNKSRADKFVSEDIMSSALKAVTEAMRQSALEARAEAEVTLSTVNASTVSNCKASKQKNVESTSVPISPEEMKDICNFREVRRQYKVKDRLPSVLSQRGKVLKRKNDMYFRSLSRPNISYLDSGSIDPSRIYGLSMGDTDIFRRKGVDKHFDGCAYVLVDNSGSMSGDKRTEACKAAALIEEGFRGLIPIKFVAFDYNGCVIHEVIKDWDEQFNNNCCWNFCKYGRDGNGNEDGFDVQIAERELMRRPETKKMLLVLSDGAPGSKHYCREAIRHARKQGIKVHGIYFEEGETVYNPDFEYMYEKDFICCPLNELDTNLESIFKKFSRS